MNCKDCGKLFSTKRFNENPRCLKCVHARSKGRAVNTYNKDWRAFASSKQKIVESGNVLLDWMDKKI